MLKAYSIGSDIDGTMIENGGDIAFLQWLEERGCLNACAIYQESHSWEQATGFDADRLGKLYAAFMHSTSYTPPPPLPGAPEAFAAISRQCNIHLITSRARKTRKPTLLHLRRHFSCNFTTANFGRLAGNSTMYSSCAPLSFLKTTLNTRSKSPPSVK